eukprot:4896649-Amphidinium_carterae.1
MWTSDAPCALSTTVSTRTCVFLIWLRMLSALSAASLTTATHSKLLNCNAKANNATVRKPKLGKLAPCSSSSVSFTSKMKPKLGTLAPCSS